MAGWKLSGSNITKVVFLLDGQQISGPETSAPWQGGFNTTAFSNGAHSLQADITGTNGVVQRIAIPVTIANTAPVPTNQAPTVSAGPDKAVTLPNSANLTGSGSDDGLPNPPAAMTFSWTKVSGPGTVTFGAPTSLTTTASFSASGSYVLRLTASDGALTASDVVGVTVNPVSNRAFKFPSAGATLSGVIAYGGLEVVGSNITKVVFLLDGQQISGPETSAPWQGGFNTTDVLERRSLIAG